MTLRKRSIVLLLGIVYLALTLNGQIKNPTEGDLKQLETDARAKLNSLSYRSRLSIVDNRLPNDPNYYSYIATSQYVRPDRSHTISEQKSSKGINRLETISIGEKRYIKRNDSDWEIQQQGDGQGTGFGSGVGTGSSVAPKIEVNCEYRGKKKIDSVQIFEYRIIRTTTYQREKGAIVNTSIKTLWFDDQGRLVKSETANSNNLSLVISKTIWEYFYDEKMVIEAPIK